MSNKNATAAMAGKAGEKNARARRSTVRRMLCLFSAHPAKLAATFALVVAVVVCTLTLPTLSGRAVDCVVGPGEVDFAGLTASLRAIALTIVAIFACQWGLAALTNRLSFDAACDLRRQAFDHIQEMPLSYIDSHEHGDLTSRIVTDVDQLTNGLVMGFQQLPTGVLTIVVTLAFMFRLNATIALVVTILTPFSVWAAKFISSHASRHFAGQTRLRGELTGLTEEMIGGISSVEAFGMAEAVSARFDEVDAALGDENFKAVFFSSLANPTMRFANALVYAAVGVFGAFVALSGGITVGGLSAFLSYADQYAKPFNDITGVVTELQNSVACAERVFALVDEPAQLPEAEDALELGEVSGAVTLDHVRFGYAAERPILTDIDLEVAPGQRIALVGHTGCGKTTLINLLMRFYDVDAGAVRVDGHDVRDLARASLRGTGAWSCRTPGCAAPPCARTSPSADPTPPTRRCARRPARPLPTASSAACPRATTRCSTATSPSPPASASCSASPASCSPGRRCSSWTRPRATSTPAPRSWCSAPLTASCAAARASWWPTASPPCATPTSSAWWTRAASPSGGPTRSC